MAREISIVRVSGSTGKHFRRVLKNAVQQGRSSVVDPRFTFHGSWERGENAAGGLCQQPAKGVYPAATMERGIARLAASTNEVRFGGPCRGRTYGPLIKSSDPPQSEPTQGELSAGKTEESEKSSS